jgi:hypothetical protein
MVRDTGFEPVTPTVSKRGFTLLAFVGCLFVASFQASLRDFQPLLATASAPLPWIESLGMVHGMPTVALRAHYDGERIVLDEPYELPANASLMVTLLASSSEEDSENAWLRGAASSDAFAFLADPAEDIYSATDGEPFRNAR